jgi:glutaredoxin-related protein
LGGEATGGVAGLDKNRLSELHEIFLVAVQMRNFDEAKASGSVSIRTYGSENTREVLLDLPQLQLKGAERCP